MFEVFFVKDNWPYCDAEVFCHIHMYFPTNYSFKLFIHLYYFPEDIYKYKHFLISLLYLWVTFSFKNLLISVGISLWGLVLNLKLTIVVLVNRSEIKNIKKMKILAFCYKCKKYIQVFQKQEKIKSVFRL